MIFFFFLWSSCANLLLVTTQTLSSEGIPVIHQQFLYLSISRLPKRLASLRLPTETQLWLLMSSFLWKYKDVSMLLKNVGHTHLLRRLAAASGASAGINEADSIDSGICFLHNNSVCEFEMGFSRKGLQHPWALGHNYNYRCGTDSRRGWAHTKKKEGLLCWIIYLLRRTKSRRINKRVTM